MIIFKELYNDIINNGGATLNPHTFSDYTADAWAVGCGSMSEHYHIIADGAGDKFTDALNKVATWATNYENAHGYTYKVGAWIDDNKPGVMIIEVVQIVPSTQDAILKAIARYQSSIYNLGSGEYVSVNAIIKQAGQYA
jgi:hypothetical protein